MSTNGYLPVQGQGTLGGQQVLTQGIKSVTRVQGSYPRCNVTVFQHGTVIPATIFGDANGAALSNPFQANADGSWIFFIPLSAKVDVLMNGGTPVAMPQSVSVIGVTGMAGPYLSLSGGELSGSLTWQLSAIPPVEDFNAVTGGGFFTMDHALNAPPGDPKDFILLQWVPSAPIPLQDYRMQMAWQANPAALAAQELWVRQLYWGEVGPWQQVPLLQPSGGLHIANDIAVVTPNYTVGLQSGGFNVNAASMDWNASGTHGETTFLNNYPPGVQGGFEFYTAPNGVNPTSVPPLFKAAGTPTQASTMVITPDNVEINQDKGEGGITLGTIGPSGLGPQIVQSIMLGEWMRDGWGGGYVQGFRSPVDGYTNLFLGGSISMNTDGTYTVHSDGGSNYWQAIKMDNWGNNNGSIRFFGAPAISGDDYIINDLTPYTTGVLTSEGNLFIKGTLTQNWTPTP
jgi:hypothetical protein